MSSAEFRVDEGQGLGQQDRLSLAGIRVLDLVKGPLSVIGSLLAELGASVARIDADKRQAESLDIQEWVRRCKNFDIVLLDRNSGSRHQDLDANILHEKIPNLIVVNVSDFGTGNSFSSWRGSDAVLHAMAGVLSRSGIDDREPIVPPGEVAYGAASSQAVFAILAAYYHKQRGAEGSILDFAALHGLYQAFDPGFGIAGSAAQGSLATDSRRNRPSRGIRYPIFPCADGWIRIAVLTPKQWDGLFAWMGSPIEFSSDSYASAETRFTSLELKQALTKFFSDKNGLKLEAEAERCGVPLVRLNSLQEALESDQLVFRNAIATQAGKNVDSQKSANGVYVIEGKRLGSASGYSRAELAQLDSSFASHKESADVPYRPFEGLRIIDIGNVVVGAEQSRLFADQGADVIKIESSSFPDGIRIAAGRSPMSESVAAGLRNKRSVQLNLKDHREKEIFLALAETADVLLSNSKPGTLRSLGIDYESLRVRNPRLVVVESSAFGDSGPMARRMGYGPLVRAFIGLTDLWRYPDEEEGYADSTTIYPDHTSGRYGAIAAVALLLRRMKTGLGGCANFSHSEVVLSQMQNLNSLSSSVPVLGQRVFKCLGDDNWAVVDVRDENDLGTLRAFLGENDFMPADQLRSSLEKWLELRTPYDASKQLQSIGIPAGPMLRVSELPTDPYFVERQVFRKETHPFLEKSLMFENILVVSNKLPPPPQRPAPIMGQHTGEVLKDWLGFSPEQIELLADSDPLAVGQAGGKKSSRIERPSL